MPTATALGGHTVPADSDPLNDGGAAIRTYAGEVDELSKIKAADTIRNNSIALIDVSDMVFPVLNGEFYVFEFRLILSAASATPDARLAFSHPGGTLTWGIDPTASALVGAASNAFLTADVPVGFVPVTLGGSYKPTANGSLQLRFAQNVATVADSKINIGSTMRARVAA